jgi:AcrR family transcriptional regulator
VTTTQDAAARGARLPRSERRAQLLEAAKDVFVQRGYHAAAMDEIAERAGVSKPVLYQHFPGKLELYLALLDSSIDEFDAQVRAALNSTHDNKRRVAATVDAYFSYVGSDNTSFRLLFENDLTAADDVRVRLDALTRRCAQAIAPVIAEDTGLSTEESQLLAAGMVGMAQVAARFWLASDGSLPRQDAASLIASLGWRGIRGFPRREGERPEADPGGAAPGTD